MKITKYLLTIITLVCISTYTVQAVILPSIFGDHMVMQQNADVKVWGWGKPLEYVSVCGSWSTDTVTVRVESSGKWEVSIKTPKTKEPQTLTIQGYNKVVIKDILMGDIWLCSGQSNMEWTVNQTIINGEEEATKATHKEIRFFQVMWMSSPYPSTDVKGEWMKCTPETMRKFSSIAYFFGRKLNKELDSPIGLISSNWGGTPIETWIPETKITSNTFLNDAAYKLPPAPWGPNKPGLTYNTMIYPLMPFTLKGVLWYQGEANVDNAYAYTDMLRTLVQTWREGFGDFDFYFAQIAPCNYANVQGAQVRDAQRRALSLIDKSTMVVMSDIGDTTDIHPRRKLEAGERFADAALNRTYGHTEFPALSPLYSAYRVEGDKIIVSFANAEGLHCTGDGLQLFEVEDADGSWHKAEAEIENDKIILTCKKVKTPQNVRFAWSNTATPMLFNKDGLPASCFNSYDWIKNRSVKLPWEK